MCRRRSWKYRKKIKWIKWKRSNECVNNTKQHKIFSHFCTQEDVCDVVYVVLKLTDWLTTKQSNGGEYYIGYITMCACVCVSWCLAFSLFQSVPLVLHIYRDFTRWVLTGCSDIHRELGRTYFTNVNKPTVSEHLPRLKVYQWYARFHRLRSLRSISIFFCCLCLCCSGFGFGSGSLVRSLQFFPFSPSMPPPPPIQSAVCCACSDVFYPFCPFARKYSCAHCHSVSPFASAIALCHSISAAAGVREWEMCVCVSVCSKYILGKRFVFLYTRTVLWNRPKR